MIYCNCSDQILALTHSFPLSLSPALLCLLFKFVGAGIWVATSTAIVVSMLVVICLSWRAFVFKLIAISSMCCAACLLGLGLRGCMVGSKSQLHKVEE